jgi:hypothetical protein
MVSAQEVYVGDSDLSSGDPASCTPPPPPPSQSEAGRVETSRVAHEEGSAWEKVAGVLVLVRVTDVIKMLCVDIRPQLPAIIRLSLYPRLHHSPSTKPPRSREVQFDKVVTKLLGLSGPIKSDMRLVQLKACPPGPKRVSP